MRDIIKPYSPDANIKEMPEHLELTQKIVKSAIELYVDDRVNFSLANVARKTGVENDYIRASLQWRDLRISPHLIFVNRLLFGLYGMLMQLKPRVVTRHSRQLLLKAAARHAT